MRQHSKLLRVGQGCIDGDLSLAGRMEDHYEVLGVSPDASQAAIRKAYQAAILQSHPDKQGGRQAEPNGTAGTYEVQRIYAAWQVSFQDPPFANAYGVHPHIKGDFNLGM